MHGNIFIRKDEAGISTEEDLTGKEIIVMNGDNAHEYAVRTGFYDNLVLTETYQEAFELLPSGKHDAILVQSLVKEQLIEQLNIKNVKAATQVDEAGGIGPGLSISHGIIKEHNGVLGFDTKKANIQNPI